MKWIFIFALMITLIDLTKCVLSQDCIDQSSSCIEWASGGHCKISDWVENNCKFSCRRCTAGNLPKAYDVSKLPPELQSLAFLVGRWRSEFGGKAKFPTIPIFTYGEQLDFTIMEKPAFGLNSINYTAFSWAVNQQDALHSEYGCFNVKSGTSQVALTTVMNNGFTTVEEGTVFNNKIDLKLIEIGRISWSRDMPVLDLRREIQLIDPQTLDQRLIMQTLTNQMQEHTFIRYKKIFP